MTVRTYVNGNVTSHYALSKDIPPHKHRNDTEQ